MAMASNGLHRQRLLETFWPLFLSGLWLSWLGGLQFRADVQTLRYLGLRSLPGDQEIETLPVPNFQELSSQLTLYDAYTLQPETGMWCSEVGTGC